MYHHPMEKLKEAVHCWKIDVENIDDEDPHGIQIGEFEGEFTIKGKETYMTTPYYNSPIKIKKHNIDTEESPNMPIIGEYRDKEMVTQVVYLLKE
jgi:hypothetical protein